METSRYHTYGEIEAICSNIFFKLQINNHKMVMFPLFTIPHALRPDIINYNIGLRVARVVR